MTNEQKTKQVLQDVLEAARFKGPSADVGALVEVAYRRLFDQRLITPDSIPVHELEEVVRRFGDGTASDE
jgi:hypothetical protein